MANEDPMRVEVARLEALVTELKKQKDETSLKKN